MLNKYSILGGIVLVASLVYGSKVQAQSCGGGFTQEGGGGGVISCVPIEQPKPYDTSPSSSPSSGSSSGSGPVSLPKHIRDFDDYKALRDSDYGYSFIAVATHSNSDDVWATWNQRNEPKAIQTALSACTQAMGKGCYLWFKSWNVSAAVARGKTEIYYATGANQQQASERALQFCKAADRGCEVVHTFVSEPLKQPKTRNNQEYAKVLQDPAFDVSKSYTPKPRGFLAIAWTGLPSSQTWPNLVVASGYSTLQEAQKTAIARCQAESKQTCSSFGLVDDRKYPLFAVYLHGQNEAYWYSNTTEKRLEKMADEHCRERGVTCQKVGVFDARRSNVSIHPIKKSQTKP
jgi:hypothetical protein